MASRWWIVLGALLAAVAVSASAYGAHGLDKTSIGQHRSDDFELAARYQLIHAIGMVLVGLVGRTARSRWCSNLAAAGFLLGMILFSGGLFGYAVSGDRACASFVPFGGGAFIFGWIALAVAGWKCGVATNEAAAPRGE